MTSTVHPAISCTSRRNGPGRSATICIVIDAFAKEYLHAELRDVRDVMVWKLDALSEYDVRRPLTPTGTNLLGLIRHLSNSEAQ